MLLKIESDINEEDNFDLNIRYNILVNRINHLHIEYELIRSESEVIRLRLNALKKTMKTLITKKKLQAKVTMLQNNMNNDFANIINRLNQISANNFANTISSSLLIRVYQNDLNDYSHKILRILLEKNETYNQNYRKRSIQRSQV